MNTMKEHARTALDPRRAVPVLLFVFVFSLVIDNGFKTMTGPMAAALGISAKTASLQASLAGVIIGIGAVVYAALADSISIRKLMVTGIGLIAVGSVIGFVFSNSWPLVLAGRLIQTCGLAAAETLYVIYVTKYLSETDQKKYLGYSTAAFQAGLLIGALTSGFISANVSWTAMFLIPLILVLTIPAIHKMVPEDEAFEGNLDLFGLLIVAVFAASLIMYMQEYAPVWLIPVIVSLPLFAWHVRSHERALVRPEFFTNGWYVTALVLVLIIYTAQLGYIFLLPFAAKSLHGLGQDQASLLMVPGYVCAVLVGIFSGQIGRFLSSRVTIFTALGMIFSSLVLGAVLIEVSLPVLVVSIVLFASGFALMYAPLVNTSLQKIPAAKSGIAIGFYNLTINIAIPLGIAYTAKLQDVAPTWFGALSLSRSHEGQVYSTITWVLALVALSGMVIYFLCDRVLVARDKSAAAQVSAA
ncbi:MFS transporter [Dermatophilus congolensis]|uniref:MFS transporter n=1 Tax=Dermatophilus congolensis TaxID=1863 RepID=UPI001AAEAC19|nr:MFS transporter [Dermatophilus congolensis]MBO3142203.1 MFS transporter [Dermatophilus congolensis]MBO3151195.1 MFS transporter [Dermatophilus congolensis]MBO3161804.1 MFS transporter [Dermatophilus congolensis]MBO3162478.1 MFS transporter [Dermatophilus congolensis]MBO3176034.1 MFS transporter [Dermatophilus congolensis]